MSDLYIIDYENEDGTYLPMFYHRPEIGDEFLTRHNAIIDIVEGQSNEEMVYHVTNLLAMVGIHEGSLSTLAEINRIVGTMLATVEADLAPANDLAAMPVGGSA